MTNKEIQRQKKISDFFRDAERKAKQNTCALCGEVTTSFANSHSVPQFVLKRIAYDGKLKTFSDIVGQYDKRNGVNNSWTFHIICFKCENKYFKDYESEETLLSAPNNLMLAEIALKNELLMLSKYRRDRETDRAMLAAGMLSDETGVLAETNYYNLRDINFEVRRSKKIIDKSLKTGFILIFSCLLDWVTPIAFQSMIRIDTDIFGNVINDTYDLSSGVRMQFLHLAVFPLKEKTCVLLFRHRDDRNYLPFEKRFEKMTVDEKLEYINYMIFRYTEHALICPKIDTKILKKKELIDLCCLNDDFDFGDGKDALPSEIPNFLSNHLSILNE